jgi:hypothetical protein
MKGLKTEKFDVKLSPFRRGTKGDSFKDNAPFKIILIYN